MLTNSVCRILPSSYTRGQHQLCYKFSLNIFRYKVSWLFFETSLMSRERVHTNVHRNYVPAIYAIITL